MQFYRNQQGWIPTAVATGDADDLYSLWNDPVDYPVRVSLRALWPLAEEAHHPVYVRTGTPAWHRP